MNRFNILFLEHGPERAAYRNAMKSETVTVDEIDYLDKGQFLQSLENALIEKRYDLVVTDAFFLPVGQAHMEHGNGEFLLDEIVERVRAVERHRTRIAVLTGYGEELFTKEKSTGLIGANYLWPKPAISQPFLTWQVEHVRAEMQRRFPEQNLAEAVYELVCSETANGGRLPWANDMAEMAKEYLATRGELNKIESVGGPLKRIAETMHCGSQFKELFEAFAQAESIQVAAKPQAWGHLRHVVNVFWLGYVILNSGLIDVADVWKRSSATKKVNRDDLIVEANFAWFLAALLHDIGLLGERVQELAERSNRLARIYPVGKWDLLPSEGYSYDDRAVIKHIGVLGAGGDRGGWFSQVWSQLRGRIDHGVLSAITILESFQEDRVRVSAGKAAGASALHNLAKHGLTRGYPSLPAINFEEAPIEALLLICDQLQVWDRETGLENAFSEFPLDSAELSPIVVDRDRNEFRATIYYYAFEQISPQGIEMQKLRKKIEGKIMSDVNPMLRKVEFKMEHAPRFVIDFDLEGRFGLGRWDSMAS